MDSNKSYEMVNHPSHYNRYGVEVIEMMRKLYGDFLVSKWSEITAFKYRQRLGLKPDNSVEQDLAKETLYLDWYNQYKENWVKTPPKFSDLTSDEKNFITKVIGTMTEEEFNKVVSFARGCGAKVTEAPSKKDNSQKQILTD